LDIEMEKFGHKTYMEKRMIWMVEK